LDDYYFKNFMNYRQRGKWRVGVYSYFYVWKYITDPSPEARAALEYFEISNTRCIYH
jgi:hypothetical protein